MTVALDVSPAEWAQIGTRGSICLADKFEILKDIGDGSFGSVALGRVRGGGSHVARRGTMVAVKTMKKTFESFASCLELREVIFLRTLPAHPHLVPALDIFLDPLSKKLHIAMEYMDGNLYQLMKARDHKPFDCSVVKSILVQILSGMEHIHHNGFFHRDIKPENILVSISSIRDDVGGAFKRYSQLITPPSTPPSYTIKIADFGLARELHSKTPYTTYVSTRWYRAPEVLLRAGEYSAPVDMWALGAMAVEIATLKPLFPGSNEVDQVWRVCEIMGSPGNWVNRQGAKVGGGQWKDGVKLAQKLGFSFPKMAPHTLDSILQAPLWPASLCDFITWCLMWDPKARPTSSEALVHNFFSDAGDPISLNSSSVRGLSRKYPESNHGAIKQAGEATQTLTSKTSAWFRKSLITRESAPAVPHYAPALPHLPLPSLHSTTQTVSSGQPPPKSDHCDLQIKCKARPSVTKRNTWANGLSNYGAPMPILPFIRPISPLSNTITAEAHAESDHKDVDTSKRIGRQLSLLSRGVPQSDPFADVENPGVSDASHVPPSRGQKEGFFSHLRKRARRISGRYQFPATPKSADLEANIGFGPAWAIVGASAPEMPLHTPSASSSGMGDGDRTMQKTTSTPQRAFVLQPSSKMEINQPSKSILKRHHSLPQSQGSHQQLQYPPPLPPAPPPTESNGVPVQSIFFPRAFRIARKSVLSPRQYEAPDEQEEILDEALASAQAAVNHMDQKQQQQRGPTNLRNPLRTMDGRPPLRMAASEMMLHVSYPTPSPSEKRHTIDFEHLKSTTQPMDICRERRNDSGCPNSGFPFPTPPYDDNEWAAAAAVAILGASNHNHWK